MPNANPDPTAIIGRLIGSLTPLALMLWAALETEGTLHWVLLGWVAFTILCFAGVAAVRAEGEKK